MLAPTKSLLNIGTSFLTSRTIKKLQDKRNAVPAQEKTFASLRAQLVNTDETLAISGSPGDIQQRRRIEIRLRKSSSGEATGSLPTPAATANPITRPTRFRVVAISKSPCAAPTAVTCSNDSGCPARISNVNAIINKRAARTLASFTSR
jgi:hypothetical protein